MITVICKPNIISTENQPNYNGNIDSVTIKDISVSTCETAKDLFNLIILDINYELDNDRVLQFAIDNFTVDGKMTKNEKVHFDRVFSDVEDSLVVVKYKSSSIEPELELLPMSSVNNVINAIDNVDDKDNDIESIEDLVDMFLSNDAKAEIAAAAKDMPAKDKETLSTMLKTILPSKAATQTTKTDKPAKTKQEKPKVTKSTRRSTYLSNIRSMNISDIPQLF